MSGQVSLTSLSITQDVFKYLLAHLKQSKSTTSVYCLFTNTRVDRLFFTTLTRGMKFCGYLAS